MIEDDVEDLWNCKIPLNKEDQNYIKHDSLKKKRKVQTIE